MQTNPIEKQRLMNAFFGALANTPTRQAMRMSAGQFPNDFGYRTLYSGAVVGKLLKNMQHGSQRNTPIIGSTRTDIWFCLMKRENDLDIDCRCDSMLVTISTKSNFLLFEAVK